MHQAWAALLELLKNYQSLTFVLLSTESIAAVLDDFESEEDGGKDGNRAAK